MLTVNPSQYTAQALTGIIGDTAVSDFEAEKACQFAVVEPQDAHSTKSAAFLDHCRALQGDRAMPRWSDFNLHKLPADVIPYMAVTDVDEAAKTFTYRFWEPAIRP